MEPVLVWKAHILTESHNIKLPEQHTTAGLIQPTRHLCDPSDIPAISMTDDKIEIQRGQMIRPKSNSLLLTAETDAELCSLSAQSSSHLYLEAALALQSPASPTASGLCLLIQASTMPVAP